MEAEIAVILPRLKEAIEAMMNPLSTQQDRLNAYEVFFFNEIPYYRHRQKRTIIIILHVFSIIKKQQRNDLIHFISLAVIYIYNNNNNNNERQFLYNAYLQLFDILLIECYLINNHCSKPVLIFITI